MLTNISTIAVTTFAMVFNPLSVGCWDLVDILCLAARLRARAGKAKLCVKVSLWRDSDKEYGPTEPRAAALSKAYSKSRASNVLYLLDKT